MRKENGRGAEDPCWVRFFRLRAYQCVILVIYILGLRRQVLYPPELQAYIASFHGSKKVFNSPLGLAYGCPLPSAHFTSHNPSDEFRRTLWKIQLPIQAPIKSGALSKSRTNPLGPTLRKRMGRMCTQYLMSQLNNRNISKQKTSSPLVSF